jgi:E3 ubiquitin-protein ligase SHPRH
VLLGNIYRKFFDPVDVSCPRSLRHEKKYRFSPSPLLCVRWDRICLDEAQLVEGANSAAAKMAHKLQRRARWCVSGTPVGSGKLEDLYGLFLFLQQDPLCDRLAWKRLIRDQYALTAGTPEDGDGMSRKSAGMVRLESICCKLMLSRTKEAVDGQLNLPGQEQTVRFLQLGPVETLFYKKQHDECLAAVRESSRLLAGMLQSVC